MKGRKESRNYTFYSIFIETLPGEIKTIPTTCSESDRPTIFHRKIRKSTDMSRKIHITPVLTFHYLGKVTLPVTHNTTRELFRAELHIIGVCYDNDGDDVDGGVRGTDSDALLEEKGSYRYAK